MRGKIMINDAQTVQFISDKIKDDIDINRFIEGLRDKANPDLSEAALDNLKDSVINNSASMALEMLDEITALNSIGIRIDSTTPNDLRLIGDRALKATFTDLYLNKEENLKADVDMDTKMMYNSVYRMIDEVEKGYPDIVVLDEAKILAEASLRKAGYTMEKNKDIDYGEDRY